MSEEARNEMEGVLFDQRGQNSRSVSLSLSDGALKVHLLDAGPSVQEFWRRGEDYEAWVEIRPKAVARLAFVLLRDRFAGHESALDEIKEYCKQNGLDHEFMNWC
jgi:hypothetical protein